MEQVPTPILSAAYCIGIVCFLSLNLLILTGNKMCSTHICLTWKVNRNCLTLTCKVDKFVHRIFIDDQYGNIQADCSPPNPLIHCESFYKNGIISQNELKNETIFKVVGHIDYHVNGNWTCRHGTSKDTARVEVTIFTAVENIRGQLNYNILYSIHRYNLVK